MAVQAERNQFRRYIGDYPNAEMADIDIESYLNDATYDLTMYFVDANRQPAPVTTFDALSPQYKPEVIVYAAIQWWWNKASKLAGRHSQVVGSASQNVGEEYDRAMQMIESLMARFDMISILNSPILIGNLSRFSKQTLTRLGGVEEEDALANITGP